jgi:hypothetical protein
MDLELIDLFQADQVFKDVNSFDKLIAENSPSLNNSTKKTRSLSMPYSMPSSVRKN